VSVPDSAPPRVAPLAAERFTDEAVVAALRAGLGDAAADRYAADPESTPNVLAVMLNHPTLAGPFLRYNFALLGRPTLNPRLRELAILRVAWRTQARYEWLQHVRLALGLGVTDTQLGGISRPVGDLAWVPLDALVLTAVDEMIATYRVGDTTWAGLCEHLDQRQRMELVYAVGTYTMLAMAFNSFDIRPDADLADTEAAHPLPPAPAV
jgi:4-carboxymuconolactone decarboxylase